MRRHGAGLIVPVLTLALVLPALACEAPKQNHVVIPLRHASGRIVARSLAGMARSGQGSVEPLKIEGIDYVAVDETRNAVLVVGADAAIREMRKIVALLDVRSRAITVRLRILRSTRQADGAITTETIGSPVVKTLNNEEATVTVGDDRHRFAASVLPRLNGDDTLSITAEIRAERGAGAGVYHRSTKRLPQGKTSLIAWVPDVFDTKVSNAAMLGAQPVTPQEQPGLFLEVSATAEPAPK